MRTRLEPVVFALLLLPPQDKPPAVAEVPKLLAEHAALDLHTEAGMRRQDAILQRLELLPPIKPAEIAAHTKTLLALEQKGRKLEKKGRNYFVDEKKKRGLYLVGGETTRPKGLLIGLHGGGAGAGDAGSAQGSYDSVAGKFGWVGIFPEVLEKTEHGWTDLGTEEFVLDLMDAALRTWKLDPDQVYFAGHSMGGYGSWTLGAHHADRVAGLAPSAGAPTPTVDGAGKINGIIEGVIPNLRNVFLSIFQSTDDPQVPPGPNQQAVKLLTEARARWGGFAFDYWEVHNVGHGLPAGGTKAIVEKIEKQRRNPIPERVCWQPVLAWKRQFYWLWWDKPVLNALVVAEYDKGKNSFRVQCDKDTKGLCLLLDARLVDFAKEVTITLNGKETFRGLVTPTLATLARTASRNDPGLVFAARAPVDGAP